MQEVVGVKFKQASKVYYFNPQGKTFETGCSVVVNTQSGVAVGTVAKSNFYVKESEIEEPFREVLREMDAEDYKKLDRLKQKAKDNLPIINEKINSLNLPMKVVDVQYAFDDTKVTITYTSEDRVDFRELLKVLASALKTKIELRQIGIRDEVKTIGALGLCGMPCCCTTFLKEGERVVVKMAKTQNMSLSPSKTGGACGKMMCCLAYEEPVYRELLSKMPKVGSTISTPDGSGVVQCNNVIKESVTVKIIADDESYKYVEYKLSDLGIDIYKDKENEEKSKVDDKKPFSKKPENSEKKFQQKQNFSAEQKDNILKNFNASVEKSEINENTGSSANSVDFKQKNDYNNKSEMTDAKSQTKNSNGRNKNGFKRKKFHHNFKHKKEN